MIIAQYFNIFIVFSFAGWIYECIFCTFKDKHWENRGFLFGPICPIYGSAVTLAMIFFGSGLISGGYRGPVWKTFLICALLSAFIEYFTSYVMERIFHAVWWDYSDVPLNINGRICIPATCGFGLVGVFIVRYILPFIISLELDRHMLLNELIAMIFMLMLGIDIAVTVASLTDMLTRIEMMQENFDKRMQSGYELASTGPSVLVSAAKHGAMTAKQNALTAKKEISEGITEYMSNMSRKDRHHMRSIRAFKTKNSDGVTSHIAATLKEMYDKYRSTATEDDTQ
ncbi:MAG: putative ABC transporter permease [Lachnospiraceae bacterium]|nr:putative ABC transporter permease [Lachnospiraceae bacterium]